MLLSPHSCNLGTSTTRFSLYNHVTFRQHHLFGCNSRVLWLQNSDLVVICIPVTTYKLCCDIYVPCCNRVTLMHLFLELLLQLVGHTATLIMCCSSNSCVAIERCYGNHISVGCFLTVISQPLICVANCLVHCGNR
jgi:hypothetical protein